MKRGRRPVRGAEPSPRERSPFGAGIRQARLGAEPCSACRAFICSSLCSGRAARGLSALPVPGQAPFPPGEGPSVPTLLQSPSGGAGGLSHLLGCWPGAAWHLIPLDFPQQSPWHGCGKQGSFHSRVTPGVAVALPQSWGALNPHVPGFQVSAVLGGYQGAFPHCAELFHSQSWCIPNQGAPLILSCTLRSVLPPVSLLQPRPWPLSPSNLDLELTLPLHPPGDLQPCMTFPHTFTSPSQFPQNSLSPPDITGAGACTAAHSTALP